MNISCDVKQLVVFGRERAAELYIFPTEMDGEPFTIVEGWHDLEMLGTEIANAAGLLPQIAPMLDAASGGMFPPKQATLHDGTVTKLLPYGNPSSLLRDHGEVLTDEQKQNLLGAWEPVSDAVKDLLGEWGFSDEYRTCDACGEAIRTSPDSYNWQPDYVVVDDMFLHIGCIDPADLLEEYVNADKLLPAGFDPEDHGLRQVDLDFENGMCGGQTDDPKSILRTLNNAGVDCWFTGSPGQFDITFWVWVEEGDVDKATVALTDTDTSCGYDPAEVMREGLKQLSKQHHDPGEGIAYNKIGVDEHGKAQVTTRTITPEEFVEGIKD